MAAPDPAHVPSSTYRLQLNGDFPFEAARRIVPYLDRLGIGACYSSPILAAVPGSRHGYDVCDHSRLNPELGGDEAFESFAAALADRGMGLTVDFVPNHMSADADHNLWWRSVLENGPSSEYAAYFDIDWDPVKPELKGKVLLPILGEQYGEALETGRLQIVHDRGAFGLTYVGTTLPLNPRQVTVLLRHGLPALEAALGPDDPALVEFQSILFHLEHLPAYTETDPDLVAARRREKEVARRRLARLVEASSGIREHIDANIRLFNGVAGDRASFDLLHELLERQAYRLSSWRTATHEINYRRFFDINGLAGLCVERPEVFEQVHARLADLARSRRITGVRLDHVDGLYDPPAYFERLASIAARDRPIYVVIEKIVSDGEPLRPDWRVHGTTGYGFLNDLNGLFVDARHAHAFRRLYERFTGRAGAFADVVYASKRLITTTSMASELNVLAHELNRISEADRRYRDFTLDSLQEALREVVACFPAYRTYVSAAGWSESDERCIDTAVSEALRRNPAREPSIFYFIRQMLLPRRDEAFPIEAWERRVRFAMKCQQYTGPVHAKGVEDTAFYRQAPLASLNEVGGEPARFGRAPDDFHRSNRIRLAEWPLAMLATSTHDGKRGEDARARINVLSEIPDQWRKAVAGWARVNAAARTEVAGEAAPDRGDEYLFYQALVGAWPPGLAGPPDERFVERMRGYLLKAVKEEKTHTSWVHPSPAYDEAVGAFVERVLTGPRARAFLKLFLPFAERVARLGMVNSLAQLVLKVVSPGVPDFYQGTELWDLALVDPDNRGAVDFDRRATWLAEMEPCLAADAESDLVGAAAGQWLDRWEDGRIKLSCTAALLRRRRQLTPLFLRGAYEALDVAGASAGHLIAIARHDARHVVMALAPRLVATLCGAGATAPVGACAWKDTVVVLPDAWRHLSFRNVLTAERIDPQVPHDRPALQPDRPVLQVANALSILPVALLEARIAEA